jgi:hypothetical protein
MYGEQLSPYFPRALGPHDKMPPENFRKKRPADPQMSGAAQMNQCVRASFHAFLIALFSLATISPAQQSVNQPEPHESDYVLHDFHFKSGETLPELRMHFTTLGKPVRDANGRVTNAVLILHGTSGSGRQFLTPQFADVLFGDLTGIFCTRGNERKSGTKELEDGGTEAYRGADHRESTAATS